MPEMKIDVFNAHGIKAFVGGCVARGDGSKFRAKAHTHTKGSPHHGWICFRSTKWLQCKELLIHELAHALTNDGHTDKWRKKVLELGGTIKEVPGIMRSYEKKIRYASGPRNISHAFRLA